MEELRDLRLFLHLAETLNFGRSSVECHVSPATLTRSIQRLETRAGHRLFDRGPRGVAITTEGLRFREYALSAVGLWDAYRAEDPDPTALRGTISIFATVTACQAILPKLLTRFRSEHPEVGLELITGDAAVALARLDEGSVDLALAALPARLPEAVVSQVVATTPLEFIAPAGSDLTIGNDSRSSAPYLLPRSGLGRQAADRWFRRNKIKPTIVAETDGHEALLTLVALGYGIGIAPRLVLGTSAVRDQLTTLPAQPPPDAFRIGLCTHRDRLHRPLIAALWADIERVQLDS